MEDLGRYSFTEHILQCIIITLHLEPTVFTDDTKVGLKRLSNWQIDDRSRDQVYDLVEGQSTSLPEDGLASILWGEHEVFLPEVTHVAAALEALLASAVGFLHVRWTRPANALPKMSQPCW